MPNDAYYRSPEWKSLREQALKRDHHRCTVKGCPSTNRLSVDHIISRRAGGKNELANLRTLCITHDNQLKENAKGKRRSNAQTHVAGCSIDGTPIDPAHPWAS